jgi:hypothetical protein
MCNFSCRWVQLSWNLPFISKRSHLVKRLFCPTPRNPYRSFPSCSMHQKKIHYPNNLTFHDNHLACLEFLYLYLFKFWDNKFHMVIRQRIIQSNSPKLSVSCLR